MTTRSEWISRGRNAIADLLDTHHAAPIIELEARISDRPWGHWTVQPHLLTHARKDLAAAGLIEPLTKVTKGGSPVTVWVPRPTPCGRKRATADAAARKRALIARLRSWSRASLAENMPNLVGKGGEAVVHNSLLAAAATGYRLVQPVRGEVSTLFGERVPGGPLDNAAWLSPMDVRAQTPTGRTYLLPIEVKNVYHWLYPKHWEVHQLLHKAALLAETHPDYPILPILICRRAHFRLRKMAADLGVLVFETYTQYVHPNERVNEEHFAQVRDELGLDLEYTADACPRLIEWLSHTPQHEAESYSDTWAHAGSSLVDAYAVLRERTTSEEERIQLLEQAHERVRQIAGEARNWATALRDSYDPTDHEL